MSEHNKSVADRTLFLEGNIFDIQASKDYIIQCFKLGLNEE